MAKRHQMSKNRSPKHEAEIKKLIKIYENYGIDTSDMSEEEFERLYRQYISSGKSLDTDLKESEKYSNIFDDDIIG